MRRLEFKAQSRTDLRDALRHSRESFGQTIHRRYSRLIDQALADLIADPARPGVRPVGTDLFLYHLRSSTRRTPRGDRITRPRHIVVFKVDTDRLRPVLARRARTLRA